MIRLDIDRSAKILFDAGRAATLDEAEAKLRRLSLVIDVDEQAAKSKRGQVAFLTAVNCGQRCFKGGVFVRGHLDEAVRVPWINTGTLYEAARQLGGSTSSESPTEAIAVAVGNNRCPEKVGVRSVVRGFAGGSVPLDATTLIEDGEFTPASVLSGALCVSEAFVRRTLSPTACERSVGWDLVYPNRNWLESTDDGSISCNRPDLWLVGLGHLGQSFAWTANFLAARRDKARVVLQDYDIYKKENTATSLLGADAGIGMKKARVCAKWLECRGFSTTIVERRFDENTRVNSTPPFDEPSIALVGVDNLATRRIISKTRGFDLILDVGLGDSLQDFTGFDIHSFPCQFESMTIFPPERNRRSSSASLLEQENYKNLRALDECSTLQLASTAVGASFVGAAAASFALAQVLKHLSGGRIDALISGDLRRVSRLRTVSNDVLFDRSRYRTKGYLGAPADG